MWIWLFNRLAPGRCCSNFKSVILKIIIQNSSLGTYHGITLEWMPENLIKEKLTLVQVMAWCHQATSYYLSQCWPSYILPRGITGPWWVNGQSDTSFCTQPQPYMHEQGTMLISPKFMTIPGITMVYCQGFYYSIYYPNKLFHTPSPVAKLVSGVWDTASNWMELLWFVDPNMHKGIPYLHWILGKVKCIMVS